VKWCALRKMIAEDATRAANPLLHAAEMVCGRPHQSRLGPRRVADASSVETASRHPRQL
jgi:hypothetical protein